MGIVFSTSESIENALKEDDKIAALRAIGKPPLIAVLKAIYDEKIEWLLPDCAPPWKKNGLKQISGALAQNTRKIRMFIKGAGYDNIKQSKREMLFIEFLESIDDNDAELMVHALTDRQLPGLTKEMVEEAFPGIFA